MATTQYIGARYVPIFYTATDNTNSWEAGVQYEPLTIVTYLNQSYTSKKPVPTTVGNPYDNPEYWVMTGGYNAQVAQLINSVHDVEDEVENINSREKRNFILIGDSFSSGVDGDDNSQRVEGGGWADRAATILEARGHNVYYMGNRVLGGNSGFASSGPFIDMLQYIVENDVDDPETITDVVVLGGTNDYNASVLSSVPAAVQAFMNYCKNTLPNAFVKVGCLSTMISAMHDTAPYYRTVESYGGAFIGDLTNLMCLKNLIGGDGLHLNATGYAVYAPFITSAILTGNCWFEFMGNCELTMNTSKFTANGNASLKPYIFYRMTPYSFDIGMDLSANGFSIEFVDDSLVMTGQTLVVGTIDGLPNRPAPSGKLWDFDILGVDSTNQILAPVQRAWGYIDGDSLKMSTTSGYFGSSSNYSKFVTFPERTYRSNNK